MDITEISNWTDIEKKITDTVKQQNSVVLDTQKDLYSFFESRRAAQPEKVLCPYCDTGLEPAELGINPIPSLSSWEDAERSQANAKTFGEMIKHNDKELISNILSIIQSIAPKERNIDINIRKIRRTAEIVPKISTIISDTPKIIESCGNDPMEINKRLVEVIEDIRKTILINI